ncbi:MAG TPA: YciI family protein [Baekduia sp.]|nr:YciI family protein [Baekduia sp.]
MKYMILIYDNAQTREHFLGNPELGAEIDAIMAELTESGEFLGGEALADPSQTRTIRVVDGVPAVTDGPFAEAKEHLGGYLMVECETPERAADIARRWPSARFTPLEVRPLMSPDGAEM